MPSMRASARFVVLSLVTTVACDSSPNVRADGAPGGPRDRGVVDGGRPSDGGAQDASGPRPDGGPAPDGSVPDGPFVDASGPGSKWLSTKGNRIYTGSGAVWHGRGANVHDTRSCNACTWGPPNPAAVKQRIDVLVDQWKADFIRLDLESYAQADGRTHYQTLTQDATYLQHIQEIVDHIGTKPGVYVLLSFWVDPTFSDMGWPTAETAKAWEVVAKTFASDAHVMYGLCNEPEHNSDGALDGQVWQAMNDNVAAIRKVESDLGTPSHLIAVQGTGMWSRRLDYYVSNPITAGGGNNIVYETHAYNPTEDFDWVFIQPAKTLPVLIGEFGPFQGVDNQDLINLMDTAEQLQLPYAGWTFHFRCPPNLITVDGAGECSPTTITPTDWGKLLQGRLAQAPLPPQP